MLRIDRDQNLTIRQMMSHKNVRCLPIRINVAILLCKLVSLKCIAQFINDWLT